MKLPLLFLFCLILLSYFTLAVNECKGTIESNEVPCLLLLPLNTSKIDCTTISVAIYNETTNIYNQTMQVYNAFNCNATFNISQPATYTHYYSNGDSGSITVANEDDDMTSLAVTLFIMLINIGIFIAPFFMKINDPVYANIIKKIFVIAGVAFLALNTAIIAYLATFAGYDLNRELFDIYLWIFTRALYVLILFLSVEMVMSTFRIKKEQKMKQRNGDSDDA